MKVEINEIDTKKKKNVTETKSWFFEMINKINKPLARFTQEKKESPNQ